MRSLPTRFAAFCLGLLYLLAVSIAIAQPAPPKLLRIRLGTVQPPPAASTLGFDFDLVVWDSAGTINVTTIENTSESADLLTFRVTIASGGGVFDELNGGATYSVSPGPALADNDGTQSPFATLTFAPALAPGSADNDVGSGDWDGTVLSMTYEATFEGCDPVTGLLTLGGPLFPGSLASWSASVSGVPCQIESGEPPEEGLVLDAGGAHYFVNASDGSCSNAHNGQYPQFVSGSNGPWCNTAAAESASFNAPTDNIWILAGTTLTGANARLTNVSIAGTQSGDACSRRFVVGAYYMDGSTARRGRNGGARPILRGSVGYYDHAGSWTGGGSSGDRYPSDEFAGMVGVDDGRMSCTRFESLHVKNAGGRGFTFDGVLGVVVTDSIVEDVWDTAINFSDCDGCEATGNYVTGANHKRPDGGEPFVGAGIACVAPCSNIVITGNYIWDGWGEGINVFSFGGSRSAEDALIEGNFVMDVDSTLLYLDSLRDSIVRRNLVVRTSRTTYWRNPGANYRGDCFTHSDEAYSVGTAPTNPSRDLLVTANICAGASEGVNFAQWGSSEHARMFYYGNLFVDNEETIGSVATTLTDSRWWSNASVLFGAYDHVRSGEGTADFDVDKNYWNSEPTAAWQDTDDVIGGCTLTKTTGWRTLDDLGTPESDGRFDLDEMLVVRAAIIAGARPASAAACTNTGVAIASRTYPTNVSIEAGPADTDFDAALYATPDIGAFVL